MPAKQKAKSKKKKATSSRNPLKWFSSLSERKKLLVVMVVFAAIGGATLVYSRAAKGTGVTHEHLVVSRSTGVTKVRETRSSKRNATVVQIANPAGQQTARAVYNFRAEAGSYQMCMFGVSQKGSPSGTLSLKVASSSTSSLGSEDYRTSDTTQYKELACLAVVVPGSATQQQQLEIMVTNRTQDTAVRVSSIVLKAEEDDHNHGTQDCQPGGMGTHGPCIDTSAIPAKWTGVNTQRLTSGSTQGPGSGDFRTRCDYSHMNFDDPILYPGQQNRAHLHVFFGNNNTDYRTTSQSLMNSGASTCMGGTFNRSAYWVPAMVDSRNGRPIEPINDSNGYDSDLEIYYKVGYQGVRNSQIQEIPNGLHIIAGNPAAARSQAELEGPSKLGYETAGYGSSQGKYFVTYMCKDMYETPRSERLPSIPTNCTAGNYLEMAILFPQCWDGRSLTSSNGRSHMAYGRTNQGGCPTSHPVAIPEIEMFVTYRITSGDTRYWRLSSDNYSGPAGYSGHADYMFAWDNRAFTDLTRNCYRPNVNCGYSLGNGAGMGLISLRETKPRVTIYRR